LQDELGRAGAKRAVLFCGHSIASDAALIERITTAIGDRYAGLFDGVKAHSPLPAVLAGTARLRDLNADAVIAIGGGSAIVTARASSILLAEGEDIHRLCTQFPEGKPPFSPKLAKPKLPQFAIPSTPTTAYAKAGSAVVDPALGQRLALFDPKTRANAIFIDPVVALSAPAPLALDAALNGFAMAVQGLEGRARDSLADALLLQAIRLFRDHLPSLATAPDNATLRGELMLAALLSGQGTDYTGGGVTSVIGHCVGARFHLNNGLVNSVLLPHAMRFNAQATGERMMLLAEVLDPSAITASADTAVNATVKFFARLNLPTRLRDLGVTRDALPRIAEDAMKDWFLHQNPRKVTGPADLIGVLEAAW
jgi:alcohol dehydrogenase class IV